MSNNLLSWASWKWWTSRFVSKSKTLIDPSRDPEIMYLLSDVTANVLIESKEIMYCWEGDLLSWASRKLWTSSLVWKSNILIDLSCEHERMNLLSDVTSTEEMISNFSELLRDSNSYLDEHFQCDEIPFWFGGQRL